MPLTHKTKIIVLVEAKTRYFSKNLFNTKIDNTKMRILKDCTNNAFCDFLLNPFCKIHFTHP